MSKFYNPTMVFNKVTGDMRLVKHLDDNYTELLKKGYSSLEVTKQHLEDLLYRYTVSNVELKDKLLLAEVLDEVLRDDKSFRSKYIGFLKTMQIEISDREEYSRLKNRRFAELMIDIFTPQYVTLNPYSLAKVQLVEKLIERMDNPCVKPEFLYGDFKLIETLGIMKSRISATELITSHSREGYDKPAKYLREVVDRVKVLSNDFEDFTDIERDVLTKTMFYIEEVLGDSGYKESNII